jgi:hypothetical protein
MTSITELRTGIATNLSSITGLRNSATIPDDPKPPIAVVQPNSIQFDTSFGRGLDTYEFTVTVIVGRVDDRTAQNTLDGFCNPSGALSVKTAIERDKTLAGKAQSLRVTEMRNYTSIQVSENTYLAAEFIVTVYA